MRKLFFILTAAILCVPFFISCQKEIDPSILTGAQNDSIYVSMVIELDTTLPSGQDTIWINRYYYDSQKRLWRVKEAEYDATGQISADTIEYRYQGTQTTPANYRYLNGASGDSTVTYLTYSNGFIVIDSTVDYISGTPSYSRTARYTASTGNQYLSVMHFRDLSNPGAFITLDSILYTRTLSNGNIVSGVDSLWSNTFWTTRNSFQYNYDNKPSFFKELQAWYLGNYQNLFTYGAGFRTNNVISGTEIQDGVGGINTDNFVYAYSYRSDGYPLTVSITSTTSNAISNKIIIKYTKL